jgi:hypothetical protein
MNAKRKNSLQSLNYQKAQKEQTDLKNEIKRLEKYEATSKSYSFILLDTAKSTKSIQKWLNNLKKDADISEAIYALQSIKPIAK